MLPGLVLLALAGNGVRRGRVRVRRSTVRRSRVSRVLPAVLVVLVVVLVLPVLVPVDGVGRVRRGSRVSGSGLRGAVDVAGGGHGGHADDHSGEGTHFEGLFFVVVVVVEERMCVV